MKLTREQERALRFLAKGDARLREAAKEGNVLLDGGERGVVGLDSGSFEALIADGLASRKGNIVSPTVAGREHGRSGSRDALATPEQEHEPSIVLRDGAAEAVIVNAAESPLGLLWRRKGKDGTRFLNAAEFAAGERLRRDFTRGQMMPRLGVNWSAAGASGREGGFGNGIAELTDTALAARQCVELALESVGPELAGVLVDVCCFLKGLERVEVERGWPARSAKLLLKTALGMLVRHYSPPSRTTSAGKPTILHWGSADFRPRIG